MYNSNNFECNNYFFSNIKKRNGIIEKFNPSKIVNAIYKAAKSTGEFDFNIANKLTEKVLVYLKEKKFSDYPSVEEIQDIVEDVLIESGFKKTAKAYIIYREQHSHLRDIRTKINSELIDSYLNKNDWLVNENSNMSFSLQGLNNFISSEVTKTYWLNKIYTPDIKNAHINGDFHIHDLGLLSVYCVGWDLYDLLFQGFKGAQGKIESRPAKHFRTALGQIVNFFYTLQGEAAGAQAFSNFDTLLAPFIYYDGLSFNEVKQAFQEFLYNINVPTRVGFQTPFTNISFDLNVPSFYSDQNVIIGGEIKDKTYKEFKREMNILNRAFLEVMLEGDSKGRVFTFPIPTYNITKDFNFDDENLTLLWEVTAKYGVPYFANYVNSEMNPEDARSMCCRLRIDNRELRKRMGGLFSSSPLTGSIGVVTINMPRIGYLSKSENEFFEKLEYLMNLAYKSLEIKRKALEHFSEQNLYPYSNFFLRDIKKRYGAYWKNHFSTIGLIGMNEACLNLLGENIASTNGYKFSEKVLEFMLEKVKSFQLESGNIYNLEATPAEGVSYRFANIDKEKYPDIICSNEYFYRMGKSPFYTNSTHLPVGFTDDIFEALNHQDGLQVKYNGGTVLHLFLGERVKNFVVIKKLVKTICSNYKLPYFSITPTFSICPSCGYLDGEHELCPNCKSTTEVYSRVVGYLRPISQWNYGKKEEYYERKTFKL
jgi:ribonucleoside-triphosphate reductase